MVKLNLQVVGNRSFYVQHYHSDIGCIIPIDIELRSESNYTFINNIHAIWIIQSDPAAGKNLQSLTTKWSRVETNGYKYIKNIFLKKISPSLNPPTANTLS